MRKTVLGLFIIGIAALGVGLFQEDLIYNDKYLVSNQLNVAIYDKGFQEIKQIVRGTKVQSSGKITMKNNHNYENIKLNDMDYYVLSSNLAPNNDKVALEEKVIVQVPGILYDNIEDGSIKGQALKGNELKVIGTSAVKNDGTVDIYHTDKGSIYSKYVSANENTSENEYLTYHQERKDTLGGGAAVDLDYTKRDKTVFANNKMPDKVYALYLNNHKETLKNIDNYIAYAKSTKINAFVVDIKENVNPGYQSEVLKKYSKTSYEKAINTLDEYKAAIKKLKDANFYVIGRITTFKDHYYTLDNPDNSILDTRTNKPFFYSDTYWPTPFNRRVWEFNVSLAKEAVLEMGFNEIQFDYVRFPDRTLSLEKDKILDFRNELNESKAQAIQRFCFYATDELHKVGAYVSIDVFGESAYTYVTAYGQYFPAISNVVDVISAMPYPDHFSRGTFGIDIPWKEPGRLLTKWADYVNARQKEIPSPAKVRTWIAAYDSIIDKTTYDSKLVEEQINALFKSGLTGGYMTWNSGSKLDKYMKQKDAYSKEY